MTVSLIRRFRVVRAKAVSGCNTRRRGPSGLSANGAQSAHGHRRRNYLSAAGGGDFRAADCAL